MSINSDNQNFNFTKYIVPIYVTYQKEIVNGTVASTVSFGKAVDCMKTYGTFSASLAA
jgi:DNA-directed RNA polymerase subunit E'/Rpb7